MKVSKMKKRYIYFILGTLLGLVVGLTFSTNVQSSDENGDIFCLAQNIYFESANQPLAGKIAVAQVVQNRVEHPSYPDTICDVVYDAKMRVNWKGLSVPALNKCQFSWYCDGKSDAPVDSTTWLLSLHIARDVLQGKYGDITEGSSHYHSTSVHPYWADSLTEVVTVDQHIFYK